MKTQLPAGLLDQNIEFFESDGNPYVLLNSKALPYEESNEGRAVIQQDMVQNIDLSWRLSKSYNLVGIELEKKWVLCRYGSFNNIPDYDNGNSKFGIEYHKCCDRNKCLLSGHVCIIPAGLTHQELKTIEAIASGEPAKLVAGKLNLTFNTTRAYLKSVHKKIDAHSRADVLNFAYKHGII